MTKLEAQIITNRIDAIVNNLNGVLDVLETISDILQPNPITLMDDTEIFDPEKRV